MSSSYRAYHAYHAYQHNLELSSGAVFRALETTTVVPSREVVISSARLLVLMMGAPNSWLLLLCQLLCHEFHRIFIVFSPNFSGSLAGPLLSP